MKKECGTPNCDYAPFCGVDSDGDFVCAHNGAIPLEKRQALVVTKKVYDDNPEIQDYYAKVKQYGDLLNLAFFSIYTGEAWDKSV